MKILLTAKVPYFPSRGGAVRSNRVWLESLAAKQHVCRFVGPAPTQETVLKRNQLRDELAAEGGTALDIQATLDNELDIFGLNGVLMHAVREPSRISIYLANQIREFQPDWVLVSSEDFGQVLLNVALQTYPGRVVYLAHTPQMLPAGPASLSPNPNGVELLKQTTAIVAIGYQNAQYIQQFTDCKPVVIHPPIYGSGPFPNYGRFSEGFITMVNPCAVKGISIFLELAQKITDYQFAALPGWGTTHADRKALEELPNVQLLKPCKDIDEVLVKTRVLLMPSLWQEGFGLSVVEAMLRGIPVLASNFGGLLEAKLGIDFLLPVRPIKHWESRFDEHNYPIPVIPEQDISPWLNALSDLLSDYDLYKQVSTASREAALAFVSSLSHDDFEAFLKRLTPASLADHSSLVQKQKLDPTAVNSLQDLDNLSPERRALLVRQLKKKRAQEAKNE